MTEIIENENIPGIQDTQTIQTTETDYIEAIKKLKESTVSIDDYNKILKQNRQLIDNLVNGTQNATDSTSTEEEEVSIDDLKIDTFLGKRCTSLDQAKKYLKYRERIMKDEDRDVFDVVDERGNIIYDGETTAEVLQSLIDQAQGSAKTFASLLSSSMF